jgi:exopolysaccharide production protein ExoZ
MAWSALLLPSRNEPLLGVAWTLQYEIVFYTLFSIAILNRRIGMAALLAWLAVIVLEWIGVLDFASLSPPSLSGAANVEFFLGMVVAIWVRRGRIPFPALCTAAGLICLTAAATLEDFGILDGYGSGARLAYGFPSAVLIAGIVSLEQEGRLHVPGWLQRLGSGSYSIYLFQFVFIGVVWQILRPAGLIQDDLTLSIYVVLAASAILGGLAMSMLVEQPLLKRCSRLLRRAAEERPGAPPPAPITRARSSRGGGSASGPPRI